MSINKLKPLPPFKLQVLTNFPFIDADFDALTNWELYCKLVEYLNKVIVPSENELISAFNDLKNYVDDFLNNLNIQEEVNNKLDEMALDGTLENLLTPIVNGILTDEKLASIVYDIWGEDWNNLATKSYVDEKVARTTDLYYMDSDVIIDYNNQQYDNINKLIPIINEVRNVNKTSFIINVRTNYASQVRGILVANIIHNTSDDTYTLSIYPRTNNNYGSYKYNSNSLIFNYIYSNLTLVNDEVTALSNFVKSYLSDLGFLPVNNTESYNVTSDYNPAHKKYVDDNVLKFSTMPTASNDYLGKVVQFIGTTDSSYTKGHFYECVSDGASTPTYSWSEISFGGNSNNIDMVVSDTFMTYSNSILTINPYMPTDDKNTIINIVNNLIDNNIPKITCNILSLDSSLNVVNSKYGNSTLTIIKPSNTSTGYHGVNYYINIDNHILYNYTNILNEYDRTLIIGGVFSFDFSNNHASTLISMSSYPASSNYPFLTPTNTSSYNVTSDYNPAHKKYVDDNVLKFSTMPTASNDYLGKVVQFIGTTDSSYTKGHFYECVSDGASTPTYSWSEISFGGSSIKENYIIPTILFNCTSSTPLEYSSSKIKFSTYIMGNTNFKNSLINALNNQINLGFKTINYILAYGNPLSKIYNNSYFQITMPDTIPTSGDYTTWATLHLDTPYILTAFPNALKNYERTIDGEYSVKMTFTNGIVTAVVFGSSISNNYHYNMLFTTNETSWTPTNDYNPVHKKYVDDKPTTYAGYDATKTQVLKNINGTLTWVDET